MDRPETDGSFGRVGCASLVAMGVAFAVGSLLYGHMCDSHSYWLEGPIWAGSVAAAALWTYRAPTVTARWLRGLGALAIALSVAIAFMSWVHSETFPSFLLTGQNQRR